MSVVIHGKIREKTGKSIARKERREGFIPGVLYGHNFKTLNIKVPGEELIEALHSGERIVNLELDNGEKHQAVIAEVARDAITEKLLNVDFHRITAKEKITLNVEIVLFGDPIGVVKEGGILEQHLAEIEIECTPDKIPDKIEVDISNLKIHEPLYVRDIKLPEGIKATEPEKIVAVISPPEPEEEITEEAQEETEEPERIQPTKGKEKEEENEKK